MFFYLKCYLEQDTRIIFPRGDRFFFVEHYCKFFTSPGHSWLKVLVNHAEHGRPADLDVQSKLVNAINP